MQKVTVSLTSCLGHLFYLWDLGILVLAADHSRVVLPLSESNHNNHFMAITRSLCLDLKYERRKQTLEKKEHRVGLPEWFELR